MRRIVLGCSLALVLGTSACHRDFNAGSDVKHTGELQFKKSGPWKIEYSTPLGMKLFNEAIEWLDDQPISRSQPANCAYNVSDVYENAGFDGNVYKTYSDPLVIGMINKAETKQGKVIRFQTKSKADFIRIVNEQLGGKIPLGAMIAGCENTRCEGEAGSGHIGMLGDVDPNGYLQVYHNNWYRPENENGQWKPYMISRKHHDNGCLRQWMPTPWLKLVRDGRDPAHPDYITSVVSAYPSLHKIDDLDPFTYFGFIAITKEMWDEIKAGKLTGGRGGVVMGKIECPQGYTLKDVGQGKMCGDGTNAWGPFTEAMKAKCLQWSPNDPVCSSDRWGWEMAKNARGEGVCPVGALLDPETTYCVEGNNAFGPFPADLVKKCENADGGSACKSARWSKTFLKGLMSR